MGFINKLKDFFYDEEEISEEEETVIPKKRENVKPKMRVEKEEPEIKKENDVTERELFRSERTFNFPIDMDDEPDFIPIARDTRIERENNEPDISERFNASGNIQRRDSAPRRATRKQENIPYSQKKQEKKFKPTPIISPVYGILEKDSSAIKIDETKEFNVTKKIDYDRVREKAYGPIKKDDEEENKGLFFNLVDDNNKSDTKEDDVKITYNDVDFESDESEDDLNIDVPKIIRNKKSKKEETNIDNTEEDNILSDSNEQDLFNLIDNMYSSEDEEE